MKKIFLLSVFVFFITLTGCHTYYPTSERPDNLKTERDEYIKIQKFYLVNGDSVDLRNFDVKYYDKYKNFEKVFVCIESNSYRDNEMFSSYKKEEKIISAEQVKSAEIEKRRINILKTIGNVSVAIIATCTILFLYFMYVILMNR